LNDFTDVKSGGSIIDSPVHLSYPFVFEHEGDVYCVPESFNTNDARLFKWDQTLKKFQYIRTLISGSAILDPTLLFYKNKWWLFCTMADKPSTNLYIYISENLQSEFIEHENNPVKTDIRSVRPAGTIINKDGMLLRPAQNCARHYGTNIEICRITELTEKTYKEEHFKSLFPDKRDKYGKGLHTINGMGDMTFIDGKRFLFNFPNFKNRIIEKSKNVFRKN